MTARAAWSAPTALWLALPVGSCAGESPPPVEGLAPTGSVRPATPPPQRLELAAPDPEPAAAPPSAAAAPVAPPTAEKVDLGELGTFDVLSWDEARRRAEKRITADQAEAELARLQSELESRP